MSGINKNNLPISTAFGSPLLNPFACLAPYDNDNRSTVNNSKNNNRGNNKGKNKRCDNEKSWRAREENKGKKNDGIKNNNHILTNNIHKEPIKPHDQMVAIEKQQKMAPREYIMSLSISDLTALNAENQYFIDISELMNTEKKYIEAEICTIDQSINDLYNSLMIDYPPYLKQIAQKQLTDAQNQRTAQMNIMLSTQDSHNKAFDDIRKKFP